MFPDRPARSPLPRASQRESRRPSAERLLPENAAKNIRAHSSRYVEVWSGLGGCAWRLGSSLPRSSLALAKNPNAFEQRQMRRADITADAALDAGIQPKSAGGVQVFLLCRVEQRLGADAHRASLDTPRAADARVRNNPRLRPRSRQHQFTADDDIIEA